VTVADKYDADRLQEFTGLRGITQSSPDPVNTAMIRQWCAALGDRNPAYLDRPSAASIDGGPIAPPAMLWAWTALGYGARASAEDAVERLYALLNEWGYSSIIATNSEQEYLRPLRHGDVLSSTKTIAAISDEKQTKLGPGFFITTLIEVVNEAGEPVGRHLHRVLKFRGVNAGAPNVGATRDRGETATVGLRPRPVVTRDTAFFFEAARQHRLLIQRCERCGRLQHPPSAACPHCGSLELGTTEASGHGQLFSYTVVHAPKAPGFTLPQLVGLVELEEGTRLVAELVDVEPEQAEIGMALELDFLELDPDLTLPAFRPPAARSPAEAVIGSRLAPLRVPIDRSFIVAAAIASRDYEPIHHDPDMARARGLDDIITNIHTSNGLVSRFITDWTGPAATLRRIAIRLGVPNFPGDVLALTGTVTDRSDGPDGCDLTIDLRGTNARGDHLTGTAVVTVPETTHKQESRS
jgi:uncharacterized protein